MINIASDDDEGSSWRVNRTRKRGRPRRESSEGSEPPKVVKGPATPEEYYHKLMAIVSGFDGVTLLSPDNPIKMAPLINKEFGDVISAKKFRSGDLFIKCKSVDQWEKVMKTQYFDGVRVLCRIPRSLRQSRGVIYGIDPSIEIDDTTRHLAEVGVVDARRLTTVRDGVKVNTTSVVLSFDTPVLPQKVSLGYQAFTVREYIPPPLRCQKCQKFSHTAPARRGKQHCSKCNGEHEYGSCTREEMFCVNCGGDHSAGWNAGCPAFQRAAQIQQVKMQEKLSYAEAEDFWGWSPKLRKLQLQ